MSDVLVGVRVGSFPTNKERYEWLLEVDMWLRERTIHEVQVHHRWGDGWLESEWLASYNCEGALTINDGVNGDRRIPMVGSVLTMSFANATEALLFKLTWGGV